MPNSFMLASNSLDSEEWMGWAEELPLAAQRLGSWKISDEIHLCPVCFEELDAESSVSSDN